MNNLIKLDSIINSAKELKAENDAKYEICNTTLLNSIEFEDMMEESVSYHWTHYADIATLRELINNL